MGQSNALTPFRKRTFFPSFRTHFDLASLFVRQHG
jgi:hypothetical protein